VADAIAKLPLARRSRALATAERQYRKAMQDAGCGEKDARRWAASLTARLRRLVEVPEGGASVEMEKLQSLYDELIKSGHDQD
jgi:hypothetical protein